MIASNGLAELNGIDLW